MPQQDDPSQRDIQGPGVPASQSAMNPQHKQSTRIVSVDILRGLTMLVMIFVNDLAEVKGLPWWTYHMPGHANGMTYVDVVFPAFLFILGMAIPLAARKRIESGDSQSGLWSHVVLRSFSLVRSEERRVGKECRSPGPPYIQIE